MKALDTKETSETILVGADPELFLLNKANGAFESAHLWVPGSKHKPMKVAGGAVQVDGVAAEFNINPAKTRAEFVAGVTTVLGELKKFIPANLDLVAIPTATFDPVYFENLPASVLELGCEPDFNAWEQGDANPPPNAMGQPFRTGGGHVHIGWTETDNIYGPGHMKDCIQVMKQLDAALYLPSLLFDRDDKRRRLYGRKGSFRPKNYGGEYRPLSNVWVGDPRLVPWVYDSVVMAMEYLLDENELAFQHLFEEETFAKALHNEDITRAELLEVHEELTGFGFPKLPVEYLHAA